MIDEIKQRAEDAPEVTLEKTRYGYRIDGEFFRRVTTFTGGIPKPWLGAWAAKTVAEYAVEHRNAWEELPQRDAVKLLKSSPWSKRDAAGDRGTAVHNAIEAFVRGESLPDMTDDEKACAEQAMKFLRLRTSQPLAVELTVYNRTHGYAGTLDLWDIDEHGVSWILDWKTSKGVYAEHAVQQAAYRNAEFAIVSKTHVDGEKWTGRAIEWTPPEKLGVVHVTDEHAKLHEIRYTDRLWTVFRAARHVKLWQLDTDSSFGKTPRETIYEEAR